MPFVRSPFVLITLLLIGTLIFFRMNDSPIRDQGASSNKAAVPEKTGEGGAVESVKKIFEDRVEGTKEKVTTAVEQKKDDAVSKVLGKQKNDVDVNVLTKEEGETITPDKVFTLDLLKGEKLYLNLKRGQKYFLSLVNGNSNTCLYIGQTQYKVENDKTIEIKFNVGGNYLIQTNLCDLRFKEHGTITVN